MSVTYLDWYQATHKVIMWHIKDHDGQDREQNHIFSSHLMYMYQIWAWQIPLGNDKKIGHYLNLNMVSTGVRNAQEYYNFNLGFISRTNSLQLAPTDPYKMLQS